MHAAVLVSAALAVAADPGSAPPPAPRPDLPPALPALSFSPAREATGPTPTGSFEPTAPETVFRPQAPPEFPTATVTGLLQADTAWFGQDARSRNAVGDVEDGSAIRRFRLGAFGQAWEGVEYYLEVDFAQQGRTALADAFFTLTDAVPGHDVRIGFFRQPVGLASRTPPRILPLLERPLPFALQPFRQIGAGLVGSDEEYGLSWEGTVFRYPSDTDGGVLGDRGGYSAAGRLSAVLWEDDETDSLLHAGVSGAFAGPADDAVRFSSRPETFSPESRGLAADRGVRAIPPFVDTGLLAAERVHFRGVELLGRRGPVWFASEATFTSVDPAERDQANVTDRNLTARRSGGSFWGAHLTAGYFLTGEVKPYDLRNAIFGRVAPRENFDPKNGRWGAVEVVGRLSHLDLTDPTGGLPGTPGGADPGRLTDLTLGANWYLNPRTKFQLNYIRAYLDSSETGVGRGGDSETDIVAVRAQVDF